MSETRYDLLIRGGRVIDGTGAPAHDADVAVIAGRIAAVGEALGEAERVIDAAGQVIAPGFIDVHSHDDVALLNNPGLDFKVAQGVTTVICGNCGAGAAPATDRLKEFYRRGFEGILGPVQDFTWRGLGEFYNEVRDAGPSVNAAFLVPHGALRIATMGLERRPPDDSELARMKELVAEGMAAGALGLSTGLIYVPGTFAQTDELIALAKVVAEFGGLYVSHIRNEGRRLLEAAKEAIHIGEEAGIPVQISHYKASGRENWGRTQQSLELIDEARERGLDVTIDVYPYAASSTALAAIAPRGQLGSTTNPNDILIASVKRQHLYEGKRLDDLADMMDLPVDAAIRRLLDEEENSVVVVMFNMDEADVRRVIQHPTCMIGSDGIPSPMGKPHPRLYGTFPRVLDHYVRQEQLLSLEEAVRRMTSLPAAKFRLADRGQVRIDAWADLVIFEPEKVIDHATYDDPRRYPSGISYVLVNGDVVVEQGAPSSRPAGRVVARS